MLYVANWPQSRSYVWKTLLHARAMENQAYVIGVNCVGIDGNNLSYSGDSMLIDPKGIPITILDPFVETEETVELNSNLLHECRKSFPVLGDADQFKINS